MIGSPEAIHFDGLSAMLRLGPNVWEVIVATSG
jgi:hypothetical protein